MFLKNTNKCTSFIAKISTFTETVKSCTLLKMVTIILGFVFFAFFLQMIFFNIQNLQTFLDEEQQPSDTYLAFCYSSYNSHKCVNHFLICWRIMLEIKNNFLSKVQQCSRESESLYQTTWVDVQQKCRHIIICRHVMNTFDWIKSLTPINFPTLANISVVIRYSQMALQLKSSTFWIGTDFFYPTISFLYTSIHNLKE